MKQLFAVLSLCLVIDVARAQTSGSADAELTLDNEAGVVNTQIVSQKPEKPKKYYSGVILGMGAYPEVTNVNKGYNVSVNAGYHYSEQMMFDLGIGMAKSQMSVTNLLLVNQKDNFEISQYQGFLGAKYQLEGILGTKFKPVGGVTLSYTYRKYNLQNGTTTLSGNTGNSTAFDAGLNAGIDYDISTTYALGLDFKYMFNLSNQVSANYANPSYGYNGKSLESLQYYIAGLSARMNF